MHHHLGVFSEHKQDLGCFDVLDRRLAAKHKAASLWVTLNCLLLSSKWISITPCPNTTGFASLSLSANNKTHPYYVQSIVLSIWPGSQCLKATCTLTKKKCATHCSHRKPFSVCFIRQPQVGAYPPAVPLIVSLRWSPSRSRAQRGAADSCQSCNIAATSIITRVNCQHCACLPVWAHC